MSEVEIAADAAENLESLPESEQRTIIETLEEVQERPWDYLDRATGDYFKVDIGDYVAIFTVDEDADVLHLWTVGEQIDSGSRS